MKAMLTSSLGGTRKTDGKRVPSVLIERNGLLDNLKKIWPQDARVLVICADPYGDEQNDIVFACLKDSLIMSGLSMSVIDPCDGRNPQIAEKLSDYDVLIFRGGPVPAQNRFFKEIQLRERLLNYGGIVVAWSAGSMNSADMAYIAPEFQGEAIDPKFERWSEGLGLTDFNMLPHFQNIRNGYLDGLHLINDISLPDSIGHEIYALTDGSYLLLDDGHETLYGEAYLLKDGQITQICSENEYINIK